MREISKPDVFGDQLQADVCVVGGGMSGLCAAIASARGGAKTVLVHDRPVLGGNASSEVRMWICGAHGEHNKETGILEEMQLENLYRNPGKDFSIWDTVLWGHAAHQKNLTLLLNTTCTNASMEDGVLTTVEAWQLTSQTRMVIEARQFIDCSGDSILAALTGALHRIGREAREEFGEGVAPQIGDDRTMGNSLLIQLHRCEEEQFYTAPDWAYKIRSPEDLPNRIRGVNATNFWWMELGGIQDTIKDAEAIRDDLYRTAYGVWDYIKNYSPEKEKASHWALHFVGSLPGKRENRRYVGDHMLTQHDLEGGGEFEDVVAFGGWTMDDHHPAGLLYPGPPTIYHPAPSPYGIPYRSLYSKNVPNLLCAGRNISATHSAMSSTRVMATCAVMGQAAGTAAALCVKHGTSPRGIYEKHLAELQQTLMDDDCWLPGKLRQPDVSLFDARLSADGQYAERVLDGWERDRKEEGHAWECQAGGSLAMKWSVEREIPGLRLVLDSNLSNGKKMACEYPLKSRPHAMPGELVKDLRIEVEHEDGSWQCVSEIKGNRKRLVEIPLHCKGKGVRITLENTWGDADPRLFSVDLLQKGKDDTVQFTQGKAWKEMIADIPAKELLPPDTQAKGRSHGTHSA
ncbi:FAD-dependent oxidoreductase [Kiritimatiellaeota bacterium B1221]|nr:FAD-dependent oxidoreductase [Kiritimatiellaeota bacterium B1221]